MQNRISLRWLIIVVGLCLLPRHVGAQDPTSASEQAVATSDDQPETPVDLLASIARIDAKTADLIAQIQQASGEERALLRTRIGDLEAEQTRDLVTLLNKIAAQEALGTDVTLLRQQGEQAARRASRRLRTLILTFQDILDAEAERRNSLSPTDLQVFEHEMANNMGLHNRFYQELVQLTKAMADATMEVDDARIFLEKNLGERSEDLYRLVELTKEELAEYRSLLAKSPDDRDLQALVFATEERYDSSKTSLLTTVHQLKQAGLDYAALEVRILELTGEITPEALDVDVALGLIDRSLIQARTWISESGPRFLIRLLLIIGILLVFWLLARLAKSIARRVVGRTKVSTSKLLEEMVISLVGRVVMVIGIIVVLSQLGINPGPVLAGLGIAGFVIGFALQDTLANFAAGAMILAYRPYDVGDLVEAAGVSGKVRDMNLVSTRILTFDHQTLIVPNSKIWGDVICNVTAQPNRRVDMVFGISYEDDIAKAEQVLGEIVTQHDKVLADPEPVIKVHTLSDSSVDFVVRPWARTDDYWDVYWDITREVKMRFDRAGISIPYPQRDVHLITADSDANGSPGDSR